MLTRIPCEPHSAASQRHDASLRHRVDRTAAPQSHDTASQGRHVDDAAALLSQHHSSHRAGDMVAADEIHGEDIGQILQLVIGGCASAMNARVVDEDVNAAEPFDDVLHARFDLVFLASVARQTHRFSSGVASQLCRRGGDRFRLKVEHRSVIGQRACDAGSKSLRSTRDQSDSSRQIKMSSHADSLEAISKPWPHSPECGQISSKPAFWRTRLRPILALNCLLRKVRDITAAAETVPACNRRDGRSRPPVLRRSGRP